MPQKKANVRRKKTKDKRSAGQSKSGIHIPASVRRAIEAHVREWQAAQQQEAKLARKLVAESEKDRIQREASLASAHGIEVELRQLARWRAACQGRSTESQPPTEKPK